VLLGSEFNTSCDWAQQKRHMKAKHYTRWTSCVVFCFHMNVLLFKEVGLKIYGNSVTRCAFKWWRHHANHNKTINFGNKPAAKRSLNFCHCQWLTNKKLSCRRDRATVGVIYCHCSACVSPIVFHWNCLYHVLAYSASKNEVTLKPDVARGRSRSLKMAPFDRSYTTNYGRSL